MTAIRRAVAMSLLAVAPAAAQTWSAPVALGPTTEGRASLAMSADGYGIAAFAYVTAGNNGVGSISSAQLLPGAAWLPAQIAIPSTYDAWLPAVSQDAGGNTILLGNAGQFDNYSSAVLLCGTATGTSGCGTAATNQVDRMRPIIHFYATGGATDPAAYVLPIGRCDLVAAGTATGAEAVLTRSGECAGIFDYALDAAGAGLAVFADKAGAVAAARRSVSPVKWRATETLFQAPAGAVLGGIAAAALPDGSAIAIWSVQLKGIALRQSWMATMAVGGTWSLPTELSASVCTPGVAAAALPGGGAAIGFAVKSGAHCELAVAAMPAGGGLASPSLWTLGAHVSRLAAAGTAGGNYVFAYDDTAKGSVYAVAGPPGMPGSPVRLGGAGTPVTAAGGGRASVVWCGTICYAAAAAIP